MAISGVLTSRRSFDEATSVFTDPFALTFDDPDHSQEERRYATIGTSSKERIVFLAHIGRTSSERRSACVQEPGRLGARSSQASRTIHE